ncbi:MAG: hypothetical protein BWK78_05060 [Thiotrichaceae bacterium IS1]|nr:MAG: hypothetical protein BWK78_05060 [Thiotrichaceae bacterium IS1]
MLDISVLRLYILVLLFLIPIGSVYAQTDSFDAVVTEISQGDQECFQIGVGRKHGYYAKFGSKLKAEDVSCVSSCSGILPTPTLTLRKNNGFEKLECGKTRTTLPKVTETNTWQSIVKMLDTIADELDGLWKQRGGLVVPAGSRKAPCTTETATTATKKFLLQGKQTIGIGLITQCGSRKVTPPDNVKLEKQLICSGNWSQVWNKKGPTEWKAPDEQSSLGDVEVEVDIKPKDCYKITMSWNKNNSTIKTVEIQGVDKAPQFQTEEGLEHFSAVWLANQQKVQEQRPWALEAYQKVRTSKKGYSKKVVRAWLKEQVLKEVK